MLVGDGPAPQSQLEPSVGQDIQGGGHLGQHGRMTEVVAQDQVAHAEVLGLGQEVHGQGPSLERGSLRLSGTERWS